MIGKASRLRAVRVTLVCGAMGGFLGTGAGAAFGLTTPSSVKVEARRATTVVLSGEVNPGPPAPPAPGTYQFLYRASSTKCDGGTSVPATPEAYLGLEPERVSQELSGLAPGTTYTACLAAHQGNSTAIGPPTTFTTAIPPETPEEAPPTEVTARSATLQGTLNPNAAGEAGEYYFEFKARSECGGGTRTIAAEAHGKRAEAASTGVSGLTPATEYTYCLTAVNAAGEASTGTAVTFQTPAAGPNVDASVGDITDTSATLHGSINPGGAPTAYRFEFRVAGGSYGAAPDGAGTVGSGTVAIAATATLHGLAPATNYEVRVVALNSIGSSESTTSFTTQGVEGGATLLDGRQWEVVSPQQKDGSAVKPVTFAGGVIQAAEDGTGITYVASGPLGEGNPEGNVAPGGSQIISVRTGPGVWSTKDVATAHRIGDIPEGTGYEYKSFSADLSSGVIEPLGETLLPPPSVRQPQEQTIYLRDGATGQYQALFNEANVKLGAHLGNIKNLSEYVAFQYATSDGRHVFVSSKEPLTVEEPGALPAANAEGNNIYEWSGAPGELGTVRLVSMLPAGEGQSNSGNGVGNANFTGFVGRNAVSADGSRVIWTGGPEEGLYVTNVPKHESLRLDVPTEPGASSRPHFEGASADGTQIFFTDSTPLVSGADASQPSEGDLYVFELAGAGEALAGHLRDLTRDTTESKGAKEDGTVRGHVIGYGSEGTGPAETQNVFFVDNGVLGSEPGVGGARPTAEGDNLYYVHFAAGVWGLPHFVATLSPLDRPTWAETEFGGRKPLVNLTSGVSSSGRYLAFMSSVSLTGYDNRDAASGAQDEEVFLYDAQTASLTCASCNPSRATPEGVLDPGEASRVEPLLVDEPGTWEGHWLAGSLPGWTPNVNLVDSTYHPRFLSNSGRLFFDSPDALVPGDANGREDVYEYEPEGVGTCSNGAGGQDVVLRRDDSGAGCVGLISSGTSPDESAFLDAGGMGPGGAEGEDVFLLTTSRLASPDHDRAFDVYDAHICSAAVPCETRGSTSPQPCAEPSSCHGSATPPPTSGYASEATLGQDNFSPAPAPRAKVPTRAQKLAKALRACRRGRPRAKRHRCEAQARRRYAAVSAKRANRAIGRVR